MCWSEWSSGQDSGGRHITHSRHSSEMPIQRTMTHFVMDEDPHHLRAGVFQDLKQLVGIGFKRSNKANIVDLFEWSDFETKELSELTGRNTIEEKKYRHIVYHCEAVYALALAPKANISRNPGCEWQLKYYGK